jgi:hypothetical protein
MTMRFRASLGVMCVAVVCLASAGTVLAVSRGSPAVAAPTVRLVLAHSILRAGQTVPVAVVNRGPSPILRALCFRLARQTGGRWMTVTRTHGVSFPCRSKAGVPQSAGTRQPLGLPLYDDLVPGQYRITLRFKPAEGKNLGTLTGPRVRSVRATLTVLAFNPGPTPHLTERRILRLAKQAARSGGDPSPTLIQHAEGTRFEAVLVSSGDLLFEWNWSYLIAVRGHFTCNACSVPPGAKTPTGSVITLVVDAKTGRGTDGGIGNRYPQLAKLGPVTTDVQSGP